MYYKLTVSKIYVNLFTCLILLASSVSVAGFNVDKDKNGLALKGHDPVAYFTMGKPTPGSLAYKNTVDGIMYQFASADNLNHFLKNSAKYQPAYGGYCAYGVTRKIKVSGDPVAWKIVDDVLYINSSLDSRTTWSKDIPGNIHKANKIWPEIRDIDPKKLF